MVRSAIDRFSRLVDGISLAGGYLAGIACVLILVLVCVEVLIRSLFGLTTHISDEYGGYLNVAVIYLGLSYTLRQGGFIRVDVLYQRFTGWFAVVVRFLIVTVSLGYVAVIFYYMVGYVQNNHRMGTRAFSIMETPVWIPQLLVLIGSAILFLQLASFLLKGLRDVP